MWLTAADKAGGRRRLNQLGLKAEASGAPSSSRILSAVTSEETFSPDPDAGRSEHGGHLSIKARSPPGSFPAASGTLIYGG